MDTDTSWPAGDPDETAIRARIDHALEHIPCAPTISRGDLARLDSIISLFNAMATHGLDSGLYDDAWNLRNHLVPFQPGDEHYDAEGDEAVAARAVRDGYTLATELEQAAALLESSGNLDLRDAVREAAALLPKDEAEF